MKFTGHAVGKPLPHDSAVGHVTGAAQYIDDLPPRSGELHVSFVGAPVAAGFAAVSGWLDGPAAIASAALAVASGALGVLVERWLFFAEAQHVVTLYYGEAVA